MTPLIGKPIPSSLFFKTRLASGNLAERMSSFMYVVIEPYSLAVVLIHEGRWNYQWQWTGLV
jgi:hypothetical protein